MTTDVLTVAPSASFRSVADILLRHRIGAVPVVEDDRSVVGIVTEADLLQKEATEARPGAAAGRVRWEEADVGDKSLSLTARDLMTTPVRTIRPEASLRSIARLMLDGHCRLPVVDAGNRLVGIVTRADLLKIFVRGDDATKRLIERMLADHGYRPPGHDIEVTVDEGMVVLRGLTATREDVAAVGALVSGVEGVVDTNNLLGFTQVEAPGGPAPTGAGDLEEAGENGPSAPGSGTPSA
ncbi:MAG: CBS domain-containing protein [Actinomycetota bacterium]